MKSEKEMHLTPENTARERDTEKLQKDIQEIAKITAKNLADLQELWEFLSSESNKNTLNNEQIRTLHALVRQFRENTQKQSNLLDKATQDMSTLHTLDTALHTEGLHSVENQEALWSTATQAVTDAIQLLRNNMKKNGETENVIKSNHDIFNVSLLNIDDRHGSIEKWLHEHQDFSQIASSTNIQELFCTNQSYLGSKYIGGPFYIIRAEAIIRIYLHPYYKDIWTTEIVEKMKQAKNALQSLAQAYGFTVDECPIGLLLETETQHARVNSNGPLAVFSASKEVKAALIAVKRRVSLPKNAPTGQGMITDVTCLGYTDIATNKRSDDTIVTFSSVNFSEKN